MTCEIKRSDKGPYYTMKIDGEFAGNYDTVQEAANDYEDILKKEKNNEQGIQV